MMFNLSIRPMLPEDWKAVSEIYSDGISTGHATFQTVCPSYAAWDASHLKECRLVALLDDTVVGWAVLSPVSNRRCYRGVAEVSIYVASEVQGQGIGSFLLRTLCREAEKAGYWTLQSTILQDNIASLRLHTKCGFRIVGRRERIAQDSFGRWLDTYLVEYRCAEDEPEGYSLL